jgi:hypothetical protein
VTAVIDGGACDDGDVWTRSDACVAGACVGSDPVPAPAEVDGGVRVERSGTDAVVQWNLAAGATASDVLRGLLASLPAGSGAGGETCFGGIAGTTATDPEVPASEAGFWYLVRGRSVCGIGPWGFQGLNGAPSVPRVSATCP